MAGCATHTRCYHECRQAEKSAGEANTHRDCEELRECFEQHWIVLQKVHVLLFRHLPITIDVESPDDLLCKADDIRQLVWR